MFFDHDSEFRTANAVSRLLCFSPGCEAWRQKAWFKESNANTPIRACGNHAKCAICQITGHLRVFGDVWMCWPCYRAPEGNRCSFSECDTKVKKISSIGALLCTTHSKCEVPSNLNKNKMCSASASALVRFDENKLISMCNSHLLSASVSSIGLCTVKAYGAGCTFAPDSRETICPAHKKKAEAKQQAGVNKMVKKIQKLGVSRKVPELPNEILDKIFMWCEQETLKSLFDSSKLLRKLVDNFNNRMFENNPAKTIQVLYTKKVFYDRENPDLYKSVFKDGRTGHLVYADMSKNVAKIPTSSREIKKTVRRPRN